MFISLALILIVYLLIVHICVMIFDRGFVLKNEKTYVCADDPSYNYPTYVMIREPKAI